MSELDRLLDCIDSLYAAAADATLWPAALGSVNRFLEGPASVLYAIDTSSDAILLWISVGFPDRMVIEYADRWHTRDPRHRFNPHNPTPELQYDYMHADEAELRADPFYDWSRHFGLGYYIGGRLHEEAPMHVYFFSNRASQQGHVKDADIERYRRIAPHLASAVTLGLKLGDIRVRNESAHTLLAALRSGVVMLNPSGTILYCNPAAERILDRRDALASDDGNNLIALRPSDNQRLRTAIATGLRSQEGAEIAKYSSKNNLNSLV
jgi:PAS domain-containing protein